MSQFLHVGFVLVNKHCPVFFFVGLLFVFEKKRMHGTAVSCPLCSQELQSYGERRSFTTPAGMEFSSEQKKSNETLHIILVAPTTITSTRFSHAQ